MTKMVNLLVDLDERFDAAARSRALQKISAAGCACEDLPGANDTVLAWIDEVFGGAWSCEADAGWNLVASRDGRPVGFATYAAQGLRYRWLRGLAHEDGVGLFGPFGVAVGERGSPLGLALLSGALAGLRAKGYRRAVISAVGGERLIRYYVENTGAQVVERFAVPDPQGATYRTVVMASGNGSNFQALAERVRDSALPLDLVALVSNVASAYAVERARAFGVPAHVVEWNRTHDARADYDRRLFDVVRTDKPELILLLGWMHLLDARFVQTFPDIVNLHPAYLPLDPLRDDVGLPDGTRIPAFRGARAVRDALGAGSHWLGASVHRVTAQTDRGEILMRAPLRITAGESQETLWARLHAVEHELVARATMRWINER